VFARTYRSIPTTSTNAPARDSGESPLVDKDNVSVFARTYRSIPTTSTNAPARDSGESPLVDKDNVSVFAKTFKDIPTASNNNSSNDDKVATNTSSARKPRGVFARDYSFLLNN
jgi:hypothetical protein